MLENCLSRNRSPLDRMGAYSTHHVADNGIHPRPGSDTGGVGWLVFQLFIAEEFSRNLVVAAVIVLVMGAHWVWTDYFSGPRQGRDE